jgi:hypothetical protein
MAKQDKIYLKGKMGDLIFYEWKGKACTRSMPLDVKQTPNTKVAAGYFGEASSYGRRLRETLGDFLPDPKDKPMMYDINTVLGQWLSIGEGNKTKLARHVSSKLKDFQFYRATSLRSRLKIEPGVSWNQRGKIIVTLPEIDMAQKISAPAHTRTVRCSIKIVGFLTGKKDSYLQSVEKTFDIPYGQTVHPAQSIELPFPLKSGNLIVAAMKMSYLVKGKAVTKPEWQPVGILDAWFK